MPDIMDSNVFDKSNFNNLSINKLLKINGGNPIESAIISLVIRATLCSALQLSHTIEP